MSNFIGGLAATALTLALAACGGASSETTKALTAACQKIEKDKAASCECKTGILAGNMESKNLEIYAFYRSEWAANAEAYDAIDKATKAATAKFSITEQDMNKISNEASLKYRKELQECEKG